MNRRVLLVDDDVSLLDACRRRLSRKFDLETAEGGRQGLEALRDGDPPAVVISDMRMPEMDGIAFLSETQKLAPDSVRMMLTGNADLQTAVSAVNEGNVFRFISKPCAAEDLSKFIEAGIRQYALVHAEKELLEKTLQGAIRLCTEIIGAVDPRSQGLTTRMREMARLFGKRLGIESLWELEVAGLLCRVGQASLPPVVVVRQRAGKQLSGVERDMFDRVPQIGHDLLANIPRLENVATFIMYSQKHFDGSGFPGNDLAGEDIPIQSRILKVVGDFVQAESVGDCPQAIFDRMLKSQGVYDPDLLRLAETLWVPQPAGSGEVVALERLRIGDVLAGDVESLDGVLLVQSGTVVSATLLERLRNYARLNQIKLPITVAGGVPSAAPS